MSATAWILVIILAIIALVIVVPGLFLLYIYAIDEKQNEHAVLRNFPVLGKMRYILRKNGT